MNGAIQEAAQRLARSTIKGPFTIEGLYPYCDRDGNIIYCRWRSRKADGGKVIRPMRLDGSAWVSGEPPAPPEGKLLYNLPELVSADPDAVVVIVEGENKVDALHELGLIVTTSGSCSSASSVDCTPLRGRRCRIWPDADPAGMKYAADMAAKLCALGCTVDVIDVHPLDLPDKGDAVDWLALHPDATADDVLALATVRADSVISVTGLEEDWPEVVLLDTPDLPAIDPQSLPSWAGEFATALAVHTETPPEIAVGMVLAACAVPCAGRLRVRVSDGYYEPSNLWVAVVYPSGGRKSAVVAASTVPLDDWQYSETERVGPEIKRLQSELATQIARAKALRAKSASAKTEEGSKEPARRAAEIEANLIEVPPPPMLWTSDATPERLGVLLADHDERMAWISSEGGIFELLGGRYSNGVPNLDLALKAHAGDAERVERGSRPSVYLRRPALTVGISPQPDVLRGLASKPGFRGRGLLARFLYLMPTSRLGYRTLDPHPMPDSVTRAYVSGLGRMLDWRPDMDQFGHEQAHLVTLSADAYAEWRDFALTIEKQMRAGGEFERATDWAGKAPGAAARVACVLHGITHAHTEPWSTPIAKETMSRALDLMAVFARHSLAALNSMGRDALIEDARYLWRWIDRGRHVAFKERDAFRAMQGRFERAEHLVSALNVLEDRGYLRVTHPERSGPGRPASPTVEVSPAIAADWR